MGEGAPRVEDTVRDTVPGAVARGTVTPHLTRLLVRAAMAGGVERTRLAAVPGMAVLDNEGIRIPTSTVMRVWELLPGRLRDDGGIGEVMKPWRPGALGVWDYLFPAAATLGEALRVAGHHMAVIADPADTLEVCRDGHGMTVTYHGPYRDHPEYPRIARFVPHMLLTVAGTALGRPLTPLRVALPDARSFTPRWADELYRTRHVETGADHPSITFAAVDVDTRLPHADPALAAILAEHARMSVAVARPVLGWLDRFHAALDTAVAGGPPSLEDVARRLALSPRTLQRRLRDHGTSWRDELEGLRRRRVERMLHDTRLSMDTIAARVGFTDSRSLRRAVHRWYGHGPAVLRSSGPA